MLEYLTIFRESYFKEYKSSVYPPQPQRSAFKYYVSLIGIVFSRKVFPLHLSTKSQQELLTISCGTRKTHQTHPVPFEHHNTLQSNDQRGLRHNCLFREKDGIYAEELLTPRPNPKLEDHPLSAAFGCLFNIIATTLLIGGRSSTCNLRTRHVMVTERRDVYRVLLGKPEIKRPLVIPRRRWE